MTERQTRINQLQGQQQQYASLGFKLSKKEKAELAELLLEQQQEDDFTAEKEKAQKELFGW